MRKFTLAAAVAVTSALSGCSSTDADMFMQALSTEINNYNQAQGNAYYRPSQPRYDVSGRMNRNAYGTGSTREFYQGNCPQGMGITPWSQKRCVRV